VAGVHAAGARLPGPGRAVRGHSNSALELGFSFAVQRRRRAGHQREPRRHGAWGLVYGTAKAACVGGDNQQFSVGYGR